MSSSQGDDLQKANPSGMEEPAIVPKQPSPSTRPGSALEQSSVSLSKNETELDAKVALSAPEPSKVAAWAPTDLTDGRRPKNWKTVYPNDARVAIRWETFYLIALSIASLVAVFYFINEAFSIDTTATEPGITRRAQASLIFNGLLLSFAAGTLGGCCFGGKCLYHFIAKRLWHEDRRIWRILAPPLSGVLSLILVMLVAGGLFQIFDPKFIENPLRVAALAALAGYFSDKALAKMSEIADTIFGGKGSTADLKDPDERTQPPSES